MNTEHGVSIRQGCRSVFLKRSTYRYEHKPKEDEAIIDALNKLVEKLPAVGFWQSYHRLRLAGYEWNHKRVYRVYTSLGLNIRRRAKKRLPARTKQQLFQPSAPNQVWSLDSQRVIRVLEQLKETRGLPNMIRVDNGPEFISHKLDAWCKDHKITLAFIQPGKPTQNAYVERFNGSIRRELLNAYVFRTLDEVREKAFEWQEDYNHYRPHKSLGYRAPINVVS